MDIQHAKHPGHGLTIQQLLHALNEELLAQTASGQLASDLDEVRLSHLFRSDSTLRPHRTYF